MRGFLTGFIGATMGLITLEFLRWVIRIEIRRYIDYPSATRVLLVRRTHPCECRRDSHERVLGS
jgi:hypothetical protein